MGCCRSKKAGVCCAGGTQGWPVVYVPGFGGEGETIKVGRNGGKSPAYVPDLSDPHSVAQNAYALPCRIRPNSLRAEPRPAIHSQGMLPVSRARHANTPRPHCTCVAGSHTDRIQRRKRSYEKVANKYIII